MIACRNISIWIAGLVTAIHLGGFATAEPLHDYQKERLVGEWFQIAQTPSAFEHDCHAVTVQIAEREDTRMTLKMSCRKGSVSGPVLAIDSILVELDPGNFGMRFVRFRQFGDVSVHVLWQAEDDSMAVLGSPTGQIGWVLSKSARVDLKTLEMGKEKLVEAGYAENAIREVRHAQ